MTDLPFDMRGGMVADASEDVRHYRPGLTVEHIKPRYPQGPTGAELVDVCQWCHNPFAYTVSRSGMHRGSVDYERLRNVLKIEDRSFLPVICDPCFEFTLGTAPRPSDVETPGAANCPTMTNYLIRMSQSRDEKRSAMK